ncbi:sulfite exporter TauE/SafE family protein [Kineococcus sp. R86509]|uniref:sulfite exporter TauE/SafE family protein n=1 Tax=Kineococcus sp. R86509 TaxID=3093851 RepID=UPI0036D384EC
MEPRSVMGSEVSTLSVLPLMVAALAAFALAVVSAVAGFGGGVLLLPVFTALFGLQVAVPMLTLAQVASNASRLWLNRRELVWLLIGWFALGAVPLAAAGGLLLGHAPLAALQRLLGVFLVVMVIWRRVRPQPHRPGERSFIAIGAASGIGSALLGSVGPLTAPFFLAYGLTRAAYIGTEAAGALTLHLTKIAAYGAGNLLTSTVLIYGLALTLATLTGAWVGKKIVGRISEQVFVTLIEIGLLAAAVLFLLGV